MSRDLIEEAVRGRIDWRRLEELYAAVLISDDMPALRLIGGVGDEGIDAVEEVFFEGSRKTGTIVQVTSEQAQRGKIRGTIKKLRTNGIDVRRLVFATRHPVFSEIRREIVAEAEEDGVSLEVRDDQYLIGQLSRPESPIFARFFGSTSEQLESLLSAPDPLEIVPDKLQHALLASMGAFVLSPHARITRNTLFDKSILAVLASTQKTMVRDEIFSGVISLFPNDKIDAAQIQASIDRLVGDGQCVKDGEGVRCSDAVLARFLDVAKKAERGFLDLVEFVISACNKVTRLNDAQKGYVERNIRRSTLQLLRSSGPLRDSDVAGMHKYLNDEGSLVKQMSQGLPVDIGRASLLAFSTFIADPEKARLLAPLAKSYAALAIRNLDPFGRRWQQNILSRNALVLDTDALLNVIIQELPEHASTVTALRALSEQGVEIIAPEHVIEEAVAHISRARRTFVRFSESLLRLPPSIVDARVWHAVVRGFYYARQAGDTASAVEYWARYYDPNSPRSFIEHILSRRRLKLKVRSLDEVHEDDEDDLKVLEVSALENKERNRLKARFRDADEMAVRVRGDISMALNLARKNSEELGAKAGGYIVTADRAFRLVEQDDAWGGRPSVVIHTGLLANLASFVCGAQISDDDIVALMFHPVAIAAADQISSDIEILASLGVELLGVPLDRLDWDLRNRMQRDLRSLEAAVTSESEDVDKISAMATMGVIRVASEAGYKVASVVGVLLDDYQNALNTAASERAERGALEDKIRELIGEARDTTKKGRRRINRIVKALGLETFIDVDEEDLQDDAGQND